MNIFDFTTNIRTALSGLDESTVSIMTFREMTEYLRKRYGVSTSFSLYEFVDSLDLNKSLAEGNLPHPSKRSVGLLTGTTPVGAIYIASTLARESGFTPGLVNSHSNARGLGQWTPTTLIEIERQGRNPSALENHLDPFIAGRSAFMEALRNLGRARERVDDLTAAQTMVLTVSAAGLKYARAKAAASAVYPTFNSFDNVVAATIAYGRGNAELSRMIVEAKRASRQFWEYAVSGLAKSRDHSKNKNVAREYDRLIATICDTLPYIKMT